MLFVAQIVRHKTDDDELKEEDKRDILHDLQVHLDDITEELHALKNVSD